MAGRVTFLFGGNDNYGASRVLVDDVRVLRSLGWEIDILLPHDGPLTPTLSALGARVEICDLHVLRRVEPAHIRVPISLPPAATATDLVVLWTLTLSAYLPALVARKVPTVCSVHELQPGTSSSLLAWIASRLSTDVMVNSEATAKWLGSFHHKKHAIEPIIAYPAAPAYEPIPLPRASRPFHVVVAGRVNGGKGHKEAIEACRIARAHGLDLRLTLLGAPYPGQERHLTALVTAMRDEPWVAYHGEVDSIRAYLADAHALLVPSIKPESFGLVALEGWAAGRIVLASDLGGLSEVTDLVQGIKFPAGDVHGMARVLLDVAHENPIPQGGGATAPAAEICSLHRRQDAWRSMLRRIPKLVEIAGPDGVVGTHSALDADQLPLVAVAGTPRR